MPRRGCGRSGSLYRPRVVSGRNFPAYLSATPVLPAPPRYIRVAPIIPAVPGYRGLSCRIRLYRSCRFVPFPAFPCFSCLFSCPRYSVHAPPCPVRAGIVPVRPEPVFVTARSVRASASSFRRSARSVPPRAATVPSVPPLRASPTKATFPARPSPLPAPEFPFRVLPVPAFR